MPPDDSALPTILAETSPHLRAQRAAITLRIWHHLASDDARVLLFEPFRAGGRTFPLIDAILMAAADKNAAFTLHLDAPQIRRGHAPLAAAFAAALADIFGENGQARIVPAWQAMLDQLLDRIALRLEQRFA